MLADTYCSPRPTHPHGDRSLNVLTTVAVVYEGSRQNGYAGGS